MGGAICGGGFAIIVRLTGVRKNRWAVLWHANNLWYESSVVARFPSLAAAAAYWRKQSPRKTRRQLNAWINCELEEG